MISKLLLLTGLIFLYSFSSFAAKTEDFDSSTPPPLPREFRAVWIATVSNIDWPSSPQISTSQQKKELLGIINQAEVLHLNALILQVRPQCDAFYASVLEPWSYFLTGQMGKAPQPYYDPLVFAIEECHKRGIELHAWFNPYRAIHPSSKGTVPADHISKKRPDLAKKYGRYYWLDPGEKDVQDHCIKVVLDVVKRYDLDGVHIDDYFYPYKETENGRELPFPDDASWEKYKKSGGTLVRDDWRRENVNVFVERFYKEVKEEKPWVKVGISPFGIWRPNYPAGVSGMDQYSELYADAKLWLQKGWVDYFTPQLYWAINSPQPYKKLLAWWVEQNTKDRHIWPGNLASKLSDGSWKAAEIIDQILATRDQKGATGNVHFSMKPFIRNSDKIDDKLKVSLYSEPALVPACPWLSSKTPDKPKISLDSKKSSGVYELSWKQGDGEKVWLWALYLKTGNKWKLKVFPSAETTYSISSAGGAEPPSKVSLSAIDRYGNESPRTIVDLK